MTAVRNAFNNPLTRFGHSLVAFGKKLLQLNHRAVKYHKAQLDGIIEWNSVMSDLATNTGNFLVKLVLFVALPVIKLGVFSYAVAWIALGVFYLTGFALFAYAVVFFASLTDVAINLLMIIGIVIAVISGLWLLFKLTESLLNARADHIERKLQEQEQGKGVNA